MGLDKTIDRFISDRVSADHSIGVQIQFVMDNIEHLEKVDKRGNRVPLAKRLFNKMLNNEDLADWERSAIDDLYEQTMRGYDLPAIGKHIDKKRKALRFG
jgi:hypothetical protein